MRFTVPWVLLGCAALAGCAGGGWSARETAVIGGFRVPECVLVDPETGSVYVSNMDAAAEQYWTDDGTGFISRLRPGGLVEALRWQDSTPQQPLHSPKGMTVAGGVLYVADNRRVVGYPVAGGAPAAPLQGPVGQRLNDMATDGQAPYVSDTGAGKVYRLSPDGYREIKAPEGVNGITFHQGRMFAVSWTLHDVYELDPAGLADPVAFGLAAHFRALDGIEVLGDGTFLVSDFQGNRVAAVSPDRRTVRTLLKVETPADIGLDPARGLLYVPKFKAGQVGVYRLEKRK